MKRPEISLSAGSYSSGTKISLFPPEPNAVVYFTLDGSPPSTASKRYHAPIELGPDTTAEGIMRLRAIAVSPAGSVSRVAAANFERAPGTVVRFRKPEAWSSAYIHYWGTEPEGLSSLWPGPSMSREDGGWYRFELLGQTSANLVFNDAGGAQTLDLTVDTPDAWFVGDERWSVDPARFSHFLFPGGVSKALVLSMDDGPVQDRKLVELLNRHGIRGTFHLNSGRLGQSGHVGRGEIASLYAGHEVSSHTVSHPYLDLLPGAAVNSEVGDDRALLSEILGQDISGHAYPFGAYNAEVIEVLQELGMAYARTASPTGNFHLPANPLVWHPTCHHSVAADLMPSFLAHSVDELSLFFIYGHSWELDAGEPNNSWAYMESLVQRLGGRGDVWYATAKEVAEYASAISAARFALNEDGLHNSSDIDLWMRSGQSGLRLPAGEGAGLVLGSVGC